MVKKFIIVDPAQQQPHSHNYSYNMNFARNAEKNGYSVHLLINEKDRSDFGGITADVERIFPHSTYDYDDIHAIWRSRAFRRLNNLKILVVSKLTTLPEANIFRDYPDFASLIKWTGRAIVAVTAPLLHVANYSFNRIVQRSRPYHKDHFAERLAEALGRAKLQPGDQVLFHSATPALLESLFELRARMGLQSPLPADCTCIFHHSTQEEHAEYWNLEYYQVAELKWLRRRWEIAAPFRTTCFQALSEALATELCEMTGLPFSKFENIFDCSMFEKAFGPDLHQLPERDGSVATIGIRATDIRDATVSDLLAALEEIRQTIPPETIRVRLLARSTTALSPVTAQLIGADAAIELVDTDSPTSYLKALAELDVMLLPYDPLLYRKRVSGVQFECAIVGTSLVVPSGTTMDASGAPGVVFSYDELSEMAGALTEALRARAAPGFKDLQTSSSKKARSNAFRDPVSEFVERFAKPNSDVVRVEVYGPVATIVSPFWGRCGSSTVFDAETEYLLDRGYYLGRIMICQSRLIPVHIQLVFGIIRENSSRVKPHLYLIASVDRFAKLRSLLNPAFWKLSALGQDVMMIGNATDHDKALARYFFDESEIAVVNHSFHGEYLKRFKNAKVVLETQDIQALQYRIRGERNRITGKAETFEQWISDEAQIWNDVDACVNLSREEQSVISRHAKNSHFIMPFINRRELASDRTWPDFLRANSIHESMVKIESFDFLLWGDTHPANIASARWFISNVCLHPDLAGSVTFVAGRLGGAMHHEFQSRPGLHFGGFLDRMDDVMRRTKLLVLPDQMGSGISIKTMDALATGRPFVATQRALRSLDLEGIDIKAVVTAEEMRAECVRLLADEDARLTRRLAANEIYERNISQKAYYEAWDGVLRSVGLTPAKDRLMGHTRKLPPPQAAWSATEQDIRAEVADPVDNYAIARN